MLEVLAISLLRGAVAVTLVWGLFRIFRGARPSVQKHTWWLACLVFLSSFATYWGLRIPVSVPESWAGPLIKPVPASVPQQTDVAARASHAADASLVLNILLWVWLAGVAVQIVRLAMDSWRLKQILKKGRMLQNATISGELHEIAIEMGLSHPPKLIESALPGSPFLVGLLRPTVVVPSGFSEQFSEEERRLTFAHELAHVKSRDVLLGLVPIGVKVLFWFFPPALWAARAWETEREAAADAAALSMIGSDAIAYKKLLLRVVVQNAPEPAIQAIGATASFHTLKARLSQLGRPDRRLNEAWLLIPVAVMLPWQLSAASPAEKTLVKNPSFEKGSETVDGWETGERIDGVRYLWDRNVARSGSSSIAIFKTADRYFPIAEWRQRIAWDGKSKKIGVWAWVKTEKAYKTVLDVQFLTPEGVQSHAWVAYIGAEEYGDLPVTQAWKRVGAVVEIPDRTTEVVIAPQIYGPGKVWYDDIEARWMSN